MVRANLASGVCCASNSSHNSSPTIKIFFILSILLAGYPADYAVVARRSGDIWYIGGISGKEEEREIEFTLPAGCEGKSFTMIIDGKDKDSFDYMPVENTNGTVKVKVLPNGGFAGMIRW